ncbi:MAG: NTP transferase domain-containing protein [Gemmatimonadetes bacterium]|nr:NTP transferase domain-containing protein [Gemmatimonadota bacterium]
MSFPLVVLAAGLSTRYGRLKQLDPLGPRGEAIMDFNVFDAARSGFGSVTFVVRREILDAVRTHVDDVLGGTFETNFVCQELDQLPDGFRAPPDRVKPWGTAHAVLCAADSLEGPFAVCNADDLYGPEAFRLLHDQMTDDGRTTQAALVGYTLENTLSGAGGVARGVCVLGKDDLLERVTEVQNIRRSDGWVTGIATDGAPVELTGQEIVSMNLWGFSPSVIDLLRRQFQRFLHYWGSDTQQECFLSTTVSAQIELEATRVTVLQAPDTWFGITHAADRVRSEAILRERVASGSYPARLADALARLG